MSPTESISGILAFRHYAYELSLLFYIQFFAGLNSDITKIVKKIEEASSPPACQFQVAGFTIPKADSTGATTTPENLQQAIDEARTDDRFVDETAVTIDQLKADGLLFDDFEETIQKVLELDLAGIGFEFVRSGSV